MALFYKRALTDMMYVHAILKITLWMCVCVCKAQLIVGCNIHVSQLYTKYYDGRR